MKRSPPHQASDDQTGKESPLPLDQLVNEGSATGCIVVLPASERPPLGWAGIFDWQTHGSLSRSIRQGIFTGAVGECAYIPWTRHGRTLHLLALGVGPVSPVGSRGTIPAQSQSAIEQNLKRLGSIAWAVSRTDFPEKSIQSLARAIPEGGELWITA